MNSLPHVHFAPIGPFHADLKRRVALHFPPGGRSTHGGVSMYLKTGLLFAWLAGSWAVAMFAPVSWWQAALLAISIGLAQAGIGFNVMHDANHGGYSRSPWLNRLLGFAGSDLMGGSSAIWRHKHNVLHHTYTNVEGLDADLEAGGLLRFAPWQKRRGFHRFQHLYVWLLYGVFPLRWFLFDDFKELVSGRIGGRAFPRPKGRALATLIVGKLGFYAWAFALPLWLHPGWHLIALWLLGSFALGNMMAIVFQLAHCAGEAAFHPAAAGLPDGADWAAHQVSTTVDFARGNALLGWYVGGLNFQVEHHLFPRICHVHYPAIAAIVEETCRAHGVRYRAHPTLLDAAAANLRWLRSLGTGAPLAAG